MTNEQCDVLVIDDSAVTRASIVRALRTAGVQAMELESPIGATRAIIRHGVRLVVADVHMPSMRGDKLMTLIGANRRLKNVKLVLISGSAPNQLDDLAEAAGAHATVAKEKGTTALVTVVRRLLEES